VPRVGKFETADHAQGRRLAAARRPEHGHELAFPDLEAHIVDRDDAREDLGEIMDFDNIGHRTLKSLVTEIARDGPAAIYYIRHRPDSRT
jgi:hypothetical protein